MIQKTKQAFLNFYNTKRKIALGAIGGVVLLITAGVILLFSFRTPAPPEDLRATTRSYEAINLTWVDSQRSDNYNIYRAEEAATGYEKVATTANRHYLDTGLDPETTYYYMITKVIGEKESEYSNSAHATTEGVGVVTGLKAGEVGHDYIKLEWDHFEGSEGYVVYRSDGRDRPYTRVRSTTQNYYFDSDLERRKPYYYVVTQIIDGEETEYSTQLEVATRDWACGTAVEYDGNFYRTVELGGRCWFAENLNYETQTGSWCYGDQEVNCDRFGRLYEWETAMSGSITESARGICPEGWYIPTDEDFKILEREVGMERVESNDSGWRGEELKIGDKLKDTSKCSEVDEDFCGSSNVDILLGGSRSSAGAFRYMGTHAFLWTSTITNDAAWRRLFSLDNPGVHRDTGTLKNAFFVRCIQEN